MTVCVLHVAAEMFPLLKTGGLADVVGALPPAQSQLGTDARVAAAGLSRRARGPRRPSAGRRSGRRVRRGQRAARTWRAATARRRRCTSSRADQFYDRPGNPYLDAAHRSYADNDRRFALLGWAAARIATGARSGVEAAYRPCARLARGTRARVSARVRARRRGRVASVMTVHNLAYQGMFAASEFGALESARATSTRWTASSSTATSRS